MALFDISYYSTSLSSQSGLYVALPVTFLARDENRIEKADVLYLLHGMTGGYTDWQRHGDLEAYADFTNMIVVCPDGGNSFYVNGANGITDRYEDHILEVVDFVEATFNTTGINYIAGLSMGGYGAVRLYLKYPERFLACGSLSGALDMKFRSKMPENIDFYKTVFGGGGSEFPEDCDCLKLAENAKKDAKIFFNCGTEDYLLQENRNFKAVLDEYNIPYEYNEYPGAHTWEYWTEHIYDILNRF